MSGYRVVFITRRFWPQWDGASRTIGNLAAALVKRGCQASVLTVWEVPRWAAEIQWRGVSVIRLPYDRQNRRGEIGYLQALTRWLRGNRDQYDLVCVSGLRHDAYAALGAVTSEVPVVLRAETSGFRGDCLWQLDAKRGRRIKRRTMKAAAWIGPSPLAHRELIAAGYPRERIHYLAHGVTRQPVRDKMTRRAARESLATDHSMLRLAEETPLAVCVGRLHRSRGLVSLITAWESILKHRPDARLWFVGNGPERTSLQQRIDARNLTGQVSLVGQFDEVDTLLAAADLFVLPSSEEDLSIALLEAMAAGLPVVACDTLSNREVVESGQQGLLVPSGDVEALATALSRVMDQPEWACQLGNEARNRIEQSFPLGKMVEAYATLFEGLVGARCPDRECPS
ncbi:MAG: glycosyltransferase family 4 protein [Pirellulales bacterium]|nr:glycosyltransferase family 4 protein [Pirellulales bacterium]